MQGVIEIDHLVVAAETLAQGVAYVEAALGVAMSPGGAHPRMATHNWLLRLGEALYLEVIAIDPAAPRPDRPRWFQLDDPAVQAELRASPRLVTWVVRTADLAGVVRAARRPLGAIESMQRGELRWQLTIPADGALLDGGVMPFAIEWPPGSQPAGRMPDRGCALAQLAAAHPDPEAVRRDLAAIGADGLMELRASAAGGRAELVAEIRTPHGLRTLR